MTRPETTNATDKLQMTPQQSAAADLLAAGSTIADAAEAVGVARQVLGQEIDTGRAPVSAALHVIRSCALFAKAHPIGSNDPDEVAVAAREREAH